MLEGKIDNKFLSSNQSNDQLGGYLTLKKSNSSSPSPCISVNFSLPNLNSDQGLVNQINLTPIFNRDKKFYTPSFILSNEQIKYQQNDEAYLMIHERKLKDIDQEKNQIVIFILFQFVPKPSKTNSYCCICKITFEDYLTVINYLNQHLNIPRHKELMRKSIYCQFIQDMSAIFTMNISSDQDTTQISQKSFTQTPIKRKKIVKIPHPEQPKRARGRPRKNISKFQSLASIPTTISISV